MRGVVNRHPLKAVLDWLRGAYPEGIPDTDHFALLAVLRRRLSEEELDAVVSLSIEHAHETPRRRIDYSRVRAVMADVLREDPSEEDIERVCRRLEEGGWTVKEGEPSVPEDGTVGDEAGRGERGEQNIERVNAQEPVRPAPPSAAAT